LIAVIALFVSFYRPIPTANVAVAWAVGIIFSKTRLASIVTAEIEFVLAERGHSPIVDVVVPVAAALIETLRLIFVVDTGFVVFTILRARSAIATLARIGKAVATSATAD
jgi:hypothetical protein